MYVLCVGACINCGVLITFNPNRVPSIRINGVREPLCAGCFARWNQIHRTGQGLESLPLHPDAYRPEPEASVDL